MRTPRCSSSWLWCSPAAVGAAHGDDDDHGDEDRDAAAASAAPGPQNATYFGEPVSVSKAGSSRYLLVLKPESYLVGVTANVAFAQQQGKTCAPLSCPGVDDDRLVVPAGTQNLTFVLPANATGTVLRGFG